MSFDLVAIRSQYPALALADNGTRRIYFDNPAGTQVPVCVAAAVADCLMTKSANLGGYFASSLRLKNVSCLFLLNSRSVIVFVVPSSIVVSSWLKLHWMLTSTRGRSLTNVILSDIIALCASLSPSEVFKEPRSCYGGEALFDLILYIGSW